MENYFFIFFKVQGSVYTVEYDVYGNEEERIIDEIEEVEGWGSKKLTVLVLLFFVQIDARATFVPC